jgi:hypothetical protein
MLHGGLVVKVDELAESFDIVSLSGAPMDVRPRRPRGRVRPLPRPQWPPGRPTRSR